MVDNPASFPVLASALPPDSKSVLTFLKALLGPILIRGNERRFWSPRILDSQGHPDDSLPIIQQGQGRHLPGNIRAGRAVLSPRRPWHHSAKGDIVSLLKVENVSK